MRKIGHLHHTWLLFVFAFHLPTRDIRLKSAPEIRGAYDGVDDGEDNQDDCDHRKRSESSASRQIALGPVGLLIHADELEEKVGHPPKVKDLSHASTVSIRRLRPLTGLDCLQ